MFRVLSEPSVNGEGFDGIVLFGDSQVCRTRKPYSTPGEALVAAEVDFSARLSSILRQQSGNE